MTPTNDDPADAGDPPDGAIDRNMAEADRANGERPPDDDDDDDSTNDTEVQYGADESPA